MIGRAIVFRRFAALIVPMIAAALPRPAMACIGPANETTFLLPVVPPVQDGEFAVEIEILSEERVLPIEARVIRVLAGTYSSDRIQMSRSSCDRTRIFKGMRLAIAGRTCRISGALWFLPYEKRFEPRDGNDLYRPTCPGGRRSR